MSSCTSEAGRLAGALAALRLLSACALSLAAGGGCGDACLRDSDCPAAMMCSAAACVAPPAPDAGGADGSLGGVGLDGGPDAGARDAAIADAPMDAAADGPDEDAALDATAPEDAASDDGAGADAAGADAS